MNPSAANDALSAASDEAVLDFLIVGSGAGGSAAAWMLVEAGHRVLMIERGPRLPEDGSTTDVKAVLREGRFKSKDVWRNAEGAALAPEEYFNLGGKTRWYGAALLRYTSDEFVGNAAQQLLPWPLRLSDLEPFYAQAEQLLGVQHREAEPDLKGVIASLKQSGWQASPLPLGLSPELDQRPPLDTLFDGFALPDGLKADAQARFLDRLQQCSNFTLLTDSTVAALLPDACTPLRVSGVKLADGRVFKATHILLAAGALHSPRLLQAYLTATALDQTLPAAAQVGRYFKRHILTAVLSFSLRVQNDRVRKTQLLTHPDFDRSSAQPLGGWVDREIVRMTIPSFVPGFIREWFARRAYGFFLQTEDGSSEANRVIAREGQPPALHYNAKSLPQWTAHAAFVAAFMWGLLKTGRLPFKQTIPLAGTAHACGTLVMGKDAATSVVDAEGRVHGLHNLYVVDGSVLPRSGRMNPALTIYAFALLVATRLCQIARTNPDATP
jgi:Choline dehydrogenase and related flavoproteins